MASEIPVVVFLPNDFQQRGEIDPLLFAEFFGFNSAVLREQSTCLYCRILADELEDGRRLMAANDKFSLNQGRINGSA
jgi:hypothetical protein